MLVLHSYVYKNRFFSFFVRVLVIFHCYSNYFLYEVEIIVRTKKSCTKRTLPFRTTVELVQKGVFLVYVCTNLFHYHKLCHTTLAHNNIIEITTTNAMGQQLNKAIISKPKSFRECFVDGKIDIAKYYIYRRSCNDYDDDQEILTNIVNKRKRIDEELATKFTIEACKYFETFDCDETCNLCKLCDTSSGSQRPECSKQCARGVFNCKTTCKAGQEQCSSLTARYSNGVTNRFSRISLEHFP